MVNKKSSSGAWVLGLIIVLIVMVLIYFWYKKSPREQAPDHKVTAPPPIVIVPEDTIVALPPGLKPQEIALTKQVIEHHVYHHYPENIYREPGVTMSAQTGWATKVVTAEEGNVKVRVSSNGPADVPLNVDINFHYYY